MHITIKIELWKCGRQVGASRTPSFLEIPALGSYEVPKYQSRTISTSTLK